MSEEKKREEIEEIARRVREILAEFSEALKRAAAQVAEAVGPLVELLEALDKKNSAVYRESSVREPLVGTYLDILAGPLVVLGKFPSFNKWKGRHWGAYSRRKKLIESDLEKLARLQGIDSSTRISPKTWALVSIFVYQKTRRLDEDNLAGQMKPFFDSLRSLGLIYQDSPKWLRRDIDQGVDRDNPRVEIRSIKWRVNLASAYGTLRKEVKGK